MSTGDSTLMLLLALNLLLLVFFMMLNSMATYGAKHAEDVLAKVREGYSVIAPKDMAGTSDVPEVQMVAWRTSLLGRMQGIVMTRIDLRVLPQEGSADKVEIEVPLGAVFDADGQVTGPEFVRNMEAAAGEESHVLWQLRGDWAVAEPMAKRAAALAAVARHVEITAGKENGLRVIIAPGAGTKSQMGLQVQGVGETVGGGVKGVEQKVIGQ